MPKKVPTYRPWANTPSGPPRRQAPKAHDHLPGRKSPFTCDRRWRAFRTSYLASNPLCVDCQDKGRVTAAVDVHHRVKRADDPSRESWFDPENMLALCKPCHAARTSRGE